MANIPIDRVVQLQPSAPGQNLTAADLLRVDLAPARVGEVIARNQQEPDVMTLLASILRNQKKNNANFQPVPFSYAVYNQQQVLSENPRRSYLLIQNILAGDILVLFEGAPTQTLDYSGNTTPLITKQTRAVRIIGGGNYEPLVVPTNAITLFTLNAVAAGLVIEGQ